MLARKELHEPAQKTGPARLRQPRDSINDCTSILWFSSAPRRRLWITQVVTILPGILAPTKLYDGLAAAPRSSTSRRELYHQAASSG